MGSRGWLSSLLVLIAMLCVSFAGAQEANSQRLPKRIVGDYGYWSKSQTPPYSAAQIPFRELTHINHSGVSFNADGSLSVPDGFIEPELNDGAHAAGVKVLLLLGGDFAGLETSGAVQTLVDNIAAFENQYQYDGVDIDWEYPASTQDRQLLVQLMNQLRKSNPDYVLSIDVPPWGGDGYNLKRLSLSLDYFNIMMYDCAGPWTAYGQLNSPIFWDPNDPAPFECEPGGSAQEAADYFLQSVPGKQLNMGTPFYGYYYKNINQLFGLCPNAAFTKDGECDHEVRTVNYTWVKKRFNKKAWQTYRDPIALVPYMLRTDGSDGYVTYDDALSTYFRVWYSDWDRGLGGTFMWSLDEDYDGLSQDLLDAMYQATVVGH
ncbi:MAG TPA: glycoside hydrolase family 18 protein [Terriglobales bacterium]|nr:glycoside hydrolase family 18 protein [Terriglobales bacterium]